MRLVMYMKYGSIMEVQVTDLADGFTRMRNLKNDGIVIESFEFQNPAKVG